MRHILLVALLITVLLPVGDAQSTVQATITYSDAQKGGGAQFLDLLDNGVARKGDVVVRATSDAWGGAAPRSATMQFSCSCSSKVLELAMTGSGGAFEGRLRVDEPELVVGSWEVRIQGVRNDGSIVALPQAGNSAHRLSVSANDADAPDVTFRGAENNRVLVGSGQSVRIDIVEPLLQRVSYKLPTMPAALNLPFPFSLGVGTFEFGEQKLTVTATDRAGHLTTKTVTVYADAVDPVVKTAPQDKFFDGVPNPITLNVTEASDFTVSARLGTESVVRDFSGSTEARDVTIELTPQGLGSGNLILEVRDVLGNAFSLAKPVNITVLETDVTLEGVRIGEERPIPGEPLKVTVEASQTTSPVPVDVDAYYGNLFMGTMEVAPTGISEHTFDVYLAPGQHNKILRIDSPETVVELNPNDQAFQVALEVFTGRVIYGNAIFHIRGDAVGTPKDAIDAAGTRYQLSLADDGQGTRWEFEVDGTTLHWSPRTPVTNIPVQKEEVDGDRGVPGVQLGLIVVALAALALRRRP